MPLVHQCQTLMINPFYILSDDDSNDDTVVASNCRPHAPPPILPFSDLSVNPPTHPEPRRVASPPPIPPSTVQPRLPPTTPPPRVLATPSFILANTPAAPYSPFHDLCPDPSSKPTPFLLLNLMTNRILHQPQDHPAHPDAPPDSSATEPPAICHARYCIISLVLDLQMPLPSQSPATLPTINIQAPSLKSKISAMGWCTLSPKKLSPTTGS
jgi:hypothetical protein